MKLCSFIIRLKLPVFQNPWSNSKPKMHPARAEYSLISHIFWLAQYPTVILEVDRHQWQEQAEPVVLEWRYQTMLSANQIEVFIEVFFNLKYLLTESIFGFDFLDADKHQ